MSKSNLYAASNQWAVRPADERFWTLEEARDACKAYADTDGGLRFRDHSGR
jgi:hypothetical protein